MPRRRPDERVPVHRREGAEQDGNVAMACVLLKVSRSAYYERSNHVPSARELSATNLGNKILGFYTARPWSHELPAGAWSRVSALLTIIALNITVKKVI